MALVNLCAQMREARDPSLMLVKLINSRAQRKRCCRTGSCTPMKYAPSQFTRREGEIVIRHGPTAFEISGRGREGIALYIQVRTVVGRV